MSELFAYLVPSINTLQGLAIMLCTPYSLDTAMRAARKEENAELAEARIQEASLAEVTLVHVTMC